MYNDHYLLVVYDDYYMLMGHDVLVVNGNCFFSFFISYWYPTLWLISSYVCFSCSQGRTHSQEHHHTTVVLLSAISVDREFICMGEDRQLVFYVFHPIACSFFDLWINFTTVDGSDWYCNFSVGHQTL